jgi:sodium/potassium-transporting ATPase subunit alpha
MNSTTATTTTRRNGRRGWHAARPLVPAAIRGEVSLPRLATLPAEVVLGELGVDAGGLSHQEAAARLAQAGPNRLPQARGPSLPGQFAAQLLHFFALLLWVAAVLAFVGQMPQLGWAIIAVVLVNGAFSFVQEYRAERATRALAALLPEEATALRDGRNRRVAAAELVPGDILLLTEGDRVSVDGRVLASDDLKVDNAALTGEVARRPTPLRLDLDRSVRTIGGFAVGTGVVFFGVSLALGTPLRAGFCSRSG